MKVKIKKLSKLAQIPVYQTKGASGFDLHSIEEFEIKPKQTILVPTGLAFKIPEGYEMQIRPRSGISLKTGLRVVNSPGTLDSDYTGEAKIIMQNIGDNNEFINFGDRVAQGVICPVLKVEFDEVENLEESERGEKGFGSTNA